MVKNFIFVCRLFWKQLHKERKKKDLEFPPLHIVKDVVDEMKFSIHPSICPVIHPWMASYREENPGRNK